MKRWPYNFDEYRRAQIAANKRKQNVVWVSRQNIAFLAAYLRKHCYETNLILCHGTRNGAEQRYWREQFPKAEIVGTEISPEGERYPMTIVHDFHEPTGLHADVMYSNSFDHVHDPERCLATWMAETNLLLLEHSDCDFDARVTEHDPFGASFEEMHELLSRFGRVRDLLVLPEFHGGCHDQRVFVVEP